MVPFWLLEKKKKSFNSPQIQFLFFLKVFGVFIQRKGIKTNRSLDRCMLKLKARSLIDIFLLTQFPIEVTWQTCVMIAGSVELLSCCWATSDNIKHTEIRWDTCFRPAEVSTVYSSKQLELVGLLRENPQMSLNTEGRLSHVKECIKRFEGMTEFD